MIVMLQNPDLTTTEKPSDQSLARNSGTDLSRAHIAWIFLDRRPTSQASPARGAGAAKVHRERPTSPTGLYSGRSRSQNGKHALVDAVDAATMRAERICFEDAVKLDNVGFVVPLLVRQAARRAPTRCASGKP